MVIICRDILHYTFFECKQNDAKVFFFHRILRIKGIEYTYIDFIAIPGKENPGCNIYALYAR